MLSQVGLVLTMQRVRVSDAGDRVPQYFSWRRGEGERADWLIEHSLARLGQSQECVECLRKVTA